MAEISAALQRSFHSIQDYIRSKQQPQRPPTGPPPVPQTPMAQISAALQRSFHSFEEYIRSKQQQQHPPAAPTPHLANLPPLPTKAPTPVASTPVALIPVAPIPMAPTALPPLPGPPTPVTPLRSNIPSQAFVATEQPPQRPPAAPTPLPAPIAPLAPLAPFVRYPTRPSASPAQIQYAQFTDPQRGSFTVDVPVGWRVSGGLQIASVGDVRPWLELNSPDGIYLLSDPDFPLSLCHMWLGFNGVMVSVGAGGQFMCLKPSAEKSADCYLSKLGARRLPQFVRVSRRPRPEIAEWVRTAAMAAGVKAGRKSKFQAIETTLERKTGANLVASLLSTCAFNGSYCPIGFAFWQSWNIVCISPAHLASSADAVRTHVLKSLAYTPAMQQVAQQITAQTNANAQAIHAAQVANFNNLQAQHRAQTAMGDAIISNYRNQEATNDSIMSGWEHNEAVYDQLSQQRSDAMMDHQRLSDDAAGKTYEVPAGSNYYWHDERTGDVVGTPTDQPPDYQNNYTQLRKL